MRGLPERRAGNCGHARASRSVQPSARWRPWQVEYAHRYEHRRDGRAISTQSEIFRLRWWRLDQIAPLLMASGFGGIVVSGAYQWLREPCPDQGVTLETLAV